MSNFCAKITTNSGRTVCICPINRIGTDSNVVVLYHACWTDYAACLKDMEKKFTSAYPSKVLEHVMEIDATLPPLCSEETELLKISQMKNHCKYSYFIDGSKLSETKSLLKKLLSAIETEYRVIYTEKKRTHILTDGHWRGIRDYNESTRDHTILQVTIIVDDKNNRKVSLALDPSIHSCFEILLTNLDHPTATSYDDRTCGKFPLNSEGLLAFIRELQHYSDQNCYKDPVDRDFSNICPHTPSAPSPI